ncbi:MAG TPA: sialidase family protein [Polyangiaceae bacterium]|nr:sialidase family protein [Polyangiaceae bacterium]
MKIFFGAWLAGTFALASGCVDQGASDQTDAGRGGGTPGGGGATAGGGVGGGGAGTSTGIDGAAGTCWMGTGASSDVSIDDAPGVTGPYAWKNVKISGGGFVSGIVFSLAQPDLVFARTDVGGAYRLHGPSRRWIPLTDWIGRDDANLMGIESIAADPSDARRVYLAAGTYVTAGNGVILRSSDGGNRWERHPIAVPMGGNANGRSMGERLAIDPNLTSTLYFASRSGLWKSSDEARTWGPVAGFPGVGDTNLGLSFVSFDRSSGRPGQPTPTFYVGVATTTGTALYRTTDAGSSWHAVPGQPPPGLMPHHAVWDGCGVLYLAYNNGPGPNAITGGAIWKYDTVPGTWLDISPRPNCNCGYGGISVDAARPTTLLVSTIDWWAPDEIYRSTNGGASWNAIGAQAVRDVAGAQWLYWHGRTPSATGWMGDMEIDPFHPNRALYVTGQGIWWSDDVHAADSDAATHWVFSNEGLEQTVALDLVSPPEGAHLISAVGDLGGFRHDDFDSSPPAGMFSQPIFGNTTALDFAEGSPSLVIRVGTSSASTTRRGAISIDGGTTWTPFATEPAASTGAGSIAISADGSTIVWSPAAGTVSYSRNRGGTWTAAAGLPTNAANSKVAADRVNANQFYLSRSNLTELYVSTDGGATFAAGATLPRGAGRPRPVFGREGDVWITTGTGLHHSIDAGKTFTTVGALQAASAVGFGHAAPGQTYPALYVAGTTQMGTGVYRSDDSGVTFQRIDDAEHRFGSIGFITGDPRLYGRVYLGSGGRGILSGDPVPALGRAAHHASSPLAQ